MPELFHRKLEAWQDKRSKKLFPLANFLMKLGFTANLATLLSLLTGLTAVYFLFENHLFFVVFAALHLLLDAIDGVIARNTHTSKFGKYLDHFSDRVVLILAIGKTFYYLNDYFVLIILGLHLLAQTIYVYSKFRAPILFTRSLSLVLLALNLITLTYLAVGVAAIYSLALQLRFFWERRH